MKRLPVWWSLGAEAPAASAAAWWNRPTSHLHRAPNPQGDRHRIEAHGNRGMRKPLSGPALNPQQIQLTPEAIQQVDEATAGHPACFMIHCPYPSHFAAVVRGHETWTARVRGLRQTPRACAMRN
jgi:hypothetical protein